jgi:hypothetical protein
MESDPIYVSFMFFMFPIYVSFMFMKSSTIIQLVISGLTAFFLAGAIFLPIINGDVLTNVFFSAGIAGVLYGFESVFRLGHVTISPALSGVNVELSVRTAGFVFWAIIFFIWHVFLSPEEE